MVRLAMAMGVLLLVGVASAGEVLEPQGPAKSTGWIVVVRSLRDGTHSGRETDEFKDKYTFRNFEPWPGFRVQESCNLRHVIGGRDPWSVSAVRYYVGLEAMVALAFLDLPSAAVTDAAIGDLLRAYSSSRFGEFTYVIHCPVRAQVEWEGDHSNEPVAYGSSRATGKVTIRLDDRQPTVIPGDLIREEGYTGRIVIFRAPREQ